MFDIISSHTTVITTANWNIYRFFVLFILAILAGIEPYIDFCISCTTEDGLPTENIVLCCNPSPPTALLMMILSHRFMEVIT